MTPEIARRPVLRAAAAGTVVWLLVLLARLWSVDTNKWIARDDAVITLSHAKNLARYGTIGVSPGGDRVEGYSSPLHLFVAWAVQLPADLSARDVTIVVLVVSVGGTGGLIGATLWGAADVDGLTGRARLVSVTLLTVGTALATAAAWTTVGWIGSGMENPLIVLAGVMVGAAVVVSPGSTPSIALTIVGTVFLAISRVELAAFIVPVVVASALVHAAASPRCRRTAFLVIFVPLAAIATAHVLRRLYFGAWLPNTAVVQDRTSGPEQLMIAALISTMLIAFSVPTTVRRLRIDDAPATIVVFLCRSAGGLAALTMVWMIVTGHPSGSIIDLMLMPALIPAIAVLVVAWAAAATLGARFRPSDHVFLALVAIPASQYLVMGPARLDQYRVLGVIIPLLVLWTALVILRVGVLSPSLTLHAEARRGVAALMVGAIGLVAVGAMGYTARKDVVRHLDWEITGAEAIVSTAQSVRDAELDGEGLVIVANPDLGKVSFDKSAIIVDLGRLGDPLLTRIAQNRPELTDEYLMQVAAPDVVEAHSGWTCEYSAWFGDARFAERYVPSTPRWAEGGAQAPGCPYEGRWTIWVRRDAEVEYQLARELIRASDPAAVVASAIASCARDDEDPFRCQPVRRAVQRASQSLRDRDSMGGVVRAMRESPTYSFDAPMLLRGSGWSSDAYDEFVRFAEVQR